MALHELSHALMAWALGVHVEKIYLESWHDTGKWKNHGHCKAQMHTTGWRQRLVVMAPVFLCGSILAYAYFSSSLLAAVYLVAFYKDLIPSREDLDAFKHGSKPA